MHDNTIGGLLTMVVLLRQRLSECLLLASPTEPKFAAQVTESFFIVFSVAIEVDGAVLPSLEYLPKDSTFVYYRVCAAICTEDGMFETVTSPLYKFQVLIT